MGPPESTHVLDLSGLRAPDMRFWTAYDEESGELLGCAALKPLTTEHAELKSMRTAPHRTREGIAARLLVHVLDEARASGFDAGEPGDRVLRVLPPAHALYGVTGSSTASRSATTAPTRSAGS